MLMLYLKKELVEAVNKNIFGRLQINLAIRVGATDPLLEQLALAILEALQHPTLATTPAFVDTLAWTFATQLLKAHSTNTEQNQPALRGHIYDLARFLGFQRSFLHFAILRF